jgi:prepilin-type processing-associated H-X9-DG protein
VARDEENIVLEGLFVHAEFPSLSESSIAANEVAQKWLLVLVDITVFLKVLGERELFRTLRTGELALFNMRCQVASEREASGVLFAAILAVANVGFGDGHCLNEGGVANDRMDKCFI